MTDRRWLLRGVVAVVLRPYLWRTALRVGRRHAPDRWWATPPHLPLPDQGWMGFRYETAFADVDGRPSPEQIIDYLEWARDLR